MRHDKQLAFPQTQSVCCCMPATARIPISRPEKIKIMHCEFAVRTYANWTVANHLAHTHDRCDPSRVIPTTLAIRALQVDELDPARSTMFHISYQVPLWRPLIRSPALERHSNNTLFQLDRPIANGRHPTQMAIRRKQYSLGIQTAVRAAGCPAAPLTDDTSDNPSHSVGPP